MDFLGVGPLELIVILIIAFIVVGPERLPQLAQSIGKTLGDLRAMSQGLTAELQQEISSVSQEISNVGQEISAVSKFDAGEELKQTLTKPLTEAQAEVQQALSAPLASPSDATAEPIPPKAPSPKLPETQDEDAVHADT